MPDMIKFICLSCGYNEERPYTTGRICPNCGRVRLVSVAKPVKAPSTKIKEPESSKRNL